jgi:chromosome segregation ATPase
MGDLFSTILWVSAVVIAISGAMRIVNYLNATSTRTTQISNQLSHIELKLSQLDHLEKLNLLNELAAKLDHLEKLDLLDQLAAKYDERASPLASIESQLASIENRVGEVVTQLEFLLEQLQRIETEFGLLAKPNDPDDDWPVKG